MHRTFFFPILAVLPPDPARRLTFFDRVKDAKRYLEKHKRIENAIDAYYNEGGESSSSRVTPGGADPATITKRLDQLYDLYKGSFFLISVST